MENKTFSFTQALISVGCVLLLLTSYSSDTFAQISPKVDQPVETDNCATENRYCEMIKYLTREIKEDKYDCKTTGECYAYGLRAYFYAESGDITAALTDINLYIKKNENSDHGYIIRGNIYFKKGDYTDALKDFSRAVELNPRFASRAFSGRGKVYYQQSEYDLALKDVERAIEISPRNSEAYYYRALIYIKRGKDFNNSDNYKESGKAYEQAMKDFSSVIELDLNGRPEVYLQRAELYETLGDKERAESDRKTYKELTEKP